MHLSSIIFILASSFFISTESRKTALKTKKYKCIEVDDDEGTMRSKIYGWDKQDEELRPIGSARLDPTPPLPTSPPMPAQSRLQQIEEHIAPAPPSLPPVTSNFISPMQPPRDSHGNPLVLSPQHCSQVTHYASMYGVRDVMKWVKSNCAFAKMYLPQATCEEINILVGSCYNKPSIPSAPAPAAVPEHRPVPTTTTTTTRITPPPTTTTLRPANPLSALFAAPGTNQQQANPINTLFGSWGNLNQWFKW